MPKTAKRRTEKHELKVVSMRRLFAGAGAFIAVTGMLATTVFMHLLPLWLGIIASPFVTAAWTIAITAVVLTEGALYAFYRLYRAQDERHEKQIKEYSDRLEKLVVARTLSLQSSQEDYRRLLELAPDGIVLHSKAKIVFANAAAARMFGAASPDDLTGRPIFDIIDKAFHGMVTVRIGMLDKGIAAPPLVERVRRLDGTTFEAEVSSVPYDRDGVPSALSFFRDISRRRKTEDELRATADMLGPIVHGSALAIVACDHAGIVTLWNPAAERLFGWTAEEALGKPDPTAGEDGLARLREDIAAGMTVDGAPSERHAKNGATVRVSTWASPIRDAKGKAVGTIGMYRR